MSDKRTAELTTINAVVALEDGFLVVDTLALKSIDAEQQNILIKTLLDYYALSAANFAIGDLKIKKVNTTNNNTTEVLLVDALGNVRIRDISQLITGTGAVNTLSTNVSDETAESIEQIAETQYQINVQNVGKFTDLQEQINNIVDVGATGTILADPQPQPILATESDCTWSVLFPTSNPNVLDFDDTTNTVICRALGIYELQVYLQIDGTIPVAGELVTLKIINVDTSTEIGSTQIQIPDDGWSGTIFARFPITVSPTTIKFTHQALASGTVSIIDGQCSVSAIKTTGIPEIINPYFIDVIGESDVLVDRTNILTAINSADSGYIIRLFGDFAIEQTILIDNEENIIIDARAAIINFNTSLLDTQVFEITNSEDVTFIRPKIYITHSSLATILRGIYVSDNSPRIDVYDGIISIVSGSATTFEGVTIAQNSAVNGVLTSGNIKVDSDCTVIACECDTITAIGTGNNIGNNKALTYTVTYTDTAIFGNNNQTLHFFDGNVGINEAAPTEVLEVSGNIKTENTVPNAETLQIRARSEQTTPGSWPTMSQAAYINLYNDSPESPYLQPPTRFIIWGRKVGDPSVSTDTNGEYTGLSPYKNYGSSGNANGDPIINGDFDPSLGIAVYKTGQVSIGWSGIFYADFLNPVGNHSAQAAMFNVSTLSATKNNPADTIPYVASFRDRHKSMSILFRSAAQTKQMTLNNTTGDIEFDANIKAPSFIGDDGQFETVIVENIVPNAETLQIRARSEQTTPGSWPTMSQAAYINLYNDSPESPYLQPPTRFIIWGRKVGDPSVSTDTNGEYTGLSPYKNYGSSGNANGDPIINGDFDPSLGIAVYKTGQVSIGWSGIFYADFLNPVGNHSAQAAMFNVSTLSATKNNPADTIPYVASFRDRHKSMSILFRSAAQTKQMTLNNTTGDIEFNANIKAPSFIGDGSQLTNINSFYAVINVDGATGTINTQKGGALGVTRNAAGNYTINHFIGDLNYWISAQVLNNTLGDYNYTIDTLSGKSTSSFTLIITNQAGVLTDKDFDLIVFR